MLNVGDQGARRSHRIKGPHDQSVTDNGCIKGLSLTVLVRNRLAAIENKLIDNCQVRNAPPSEPAPFLTVFLSVRSEKATQNHDEICNDGNQDVGTADTSQKGQVEQDKWGCEGPVHISCPVQFTEVCLMCVGDFLVRLNHGVLLEADAVARGQSKVSEERKRGNEGRQGVEESFLLLLSDAVRIVLAIGLTTGARKVMP